jgi:putative hemolysin
MGSVTGEIVLIMVLIFANGLLAMSEFALVSARKSRLQQKAAAGDNRATVGLSLANSPSPFLSTVQVGITLVGIFAGAYGGATLAEKLSAALPSLPWIDRYRDELSFGIVVVVITYFSLVVGELVPKRLALANPERIVLLVAKPMRFLSKAANPGVRFLTVSSDTVLKIIGFKTTSEEPVTEEEIRILIDQGTLAGVFHPDERELVNRAFRLADRQVSLLMTPRAEIVWLDFNDSPEEIAAKISAHGHSRYPAAQASLDNIAGIVRAKDLLEQTLTNQKPDLRAALRQPLFVPETMPAIKLLGLFRKSAKHLALVVNEYGGVQGLVTHHDILEAVVGEIASVTQPEEEPIVTREDGSWLVDGLFPMEDFKKVTGVERLPGEEEGGYLTLAGFVLQQLSRIPSVGDSFEAAGLKFEVVDMDGRRVDRLLVMPLRETETLAKEGKQLE